MWIGDKVVCINNGNCKEGNIVQMHIVNDGVICDIGLSDGSVVQSNVEYVYRLVGAEEDEDT